MGAQREITEYLKIDLETEKWICKCCDHVLGSARDNYKKGCLLRHVNPNDIWDPVIEGPWSFSPDPEWIGVVEFYCPNCGTMIENEVIPLGHPITHDIELDIDKLKAKYLDKEVAK